MTQHETIAALVVVAVVGYLIGSKQAMKAASAAATPSADTLGWLNWNAPASMTTS